MAGAVPDARRLSFSLGQHLAAATSGRGASPGGGVYGESAFFLLATDSPALERAALPLRSSHALGMEDDAALGFAQCRSDRSYHRGRPIAVHERSDSHFFRSRQPA